jgi:hypothetical protein
MPTFPKHLLPCEGRGGVGIFRLRMTIRFALRHASLKMTDVGMKRIDKELILKALEERAS